MSTADRNQYFLNLPCAFQSLFNILADGSSGQLNSFLVKLLFYKGFSFYVLGILDVTLCMDSFQIMILFCKTLNFRINRFSCGILVFLLRF